MKGIQILFFCLLLPFSVFSQEFTFKHYGKESGISQETIHKILKDSDGFIWIGTQDGLNRFDGSNFSIFKKERNNPNSISGNFINDVLDDGQRLWVATRNNGLNYYDKKKDAFFKANASEDNCVGMVMDANETIYAGFYKEGIAIFSTQNGKVLEIIIPEFSIFKDKIITTLQILNHIELWVATNEGKIYIVNLSKPQTDIQTIDFTRFFQNVNVIFQDHRDIWIGTEKGLFAFDVSKMTFAKLDLINTTGNIENNTNVNDLVNNKEHYFIGTDEGLYMARKPNDSKSELKVVHHFKGDRNNKNSITSNKVYDLHLQADLLWIGTNHLDVLYLGNPVFKSIGTTSKINLNNDFIFSVFKTDQYLFVGTRGGLNGIDQQGISYPITVENTQNKLSNNVIRGIVKDADNFLWLATTKGISILDLHHFNPKNPKITTIFHDPNQKNSLSHNNTRSVFLDHQNRIWVTTFGGGINRFTGNVQKGIFTFQQYTANHPTSAISSDFTYNMSQDRDHNYWIATDNGLNKLEFLNSDTNLPVFTKISIDLSSNHSVIASYQDWENQTLWIGSQIGLSKMDLKTGKVTYVDAYPELIDNVVYSIHKDPKKNLWLSTNTGLIVINPEKKKFSHFTQKSGLLNSEYNLGAALQEGDVFYFGGPNGLNYFKVSDIPTLFNEGHLLFTSLIVKNNKVSAFNNPEILSKNIYQTRQITLKHNDFPVYLTFSDLHYKPFNSNEYVYRLSSKDAHWNNLKERKEIQLLKLPPGKHLLQVQGKSDDVLWNKPPLEISIIVVPPWYLSTWAYVFYVLLLLAIIAFFYKLETDNIIHRNNKVQLTEIANQNEIIQRTLAEKDVLFKEIHHRVKNNLQIISSILSLQKRYLKNEDAVNALNDTQNRINSISLIHQKLYSDNRIVAVNIREYINQLAKDIIHTHSDSVHQVLFDSDIVDMLLEVDTATPIGLILNELITNSLKHNAGQEVLSIRIRLTKETDRLVLELKDNGKGVPNGIDVTQSKSYGMKMVSLLLKKLKGEIQFIHENGLKIIISIYQYKEFEN